MNGKIWDALQQQGGQIAKPCLKIGGRNPADFEIFCLFASF